MQGCRLTVAPANPRLCPFCRLNLKSLMGEEDTAAEPSGGVEPACAASLSCSPAVTSTGSGPCDIYGMVGAVCTHTIP